MNEYSKLFSGLRLTVFVNQKEYIGALSQTPGIRLLVHRQDHYPFVEDDGMDIGTGVKTSMKLKFVRTPFKNYHWFKEYY